MANLSANEDQVFALLALPNFSMATAMMTRISNQWRMHMIFFLYVDCTFHFCVVTLSVFMCIVGMWRDVIAYVFGLSM